jgi:putative transposase
VSAKSAILGYGVTMPRTARGAPGGMVFHILNRAVARMPLFEKAADYHAFGRRRAGNARPIADADLCLRVDAEHWYRLL